MGLLKLTESERLEILNLHNNARIIKEQVPVVGTQQTPMDDKAKIMAIQTLLKTKYQSNLGNSGKKGDGIDGALGPKTLTALSTAMKSKVAPATAEVKPATAVVPATAEVKPATTVVEPATAEVKPVTTVVPATAEVKPVTTVVPATAEVKPVTTVVQAAPLSNRDQRRERQDLRRSNRRDMQNLRAGQQGQQQ